MLYMRRYLREEQQARQWAEIILQFVCPADLTNEEARNLPNGKQRLLETGYALDLNPQLRLPDCAGYQEPDRHHPQGR